MQKNISSIIIVFVQENLICSPLKIENRFVYKFIIIRTIEPPILNENRTAIVPKLNSRLDSLLSSFVISIEY